MVRNQARGRGILVALAACATLCAIPASALAAKAYRPPAGKIFHGVSDTGLIHDYNIFRKSIDAHPPLLQDFYHWGTPLTTGALDRWHATETRGVLSLSTSSGNGPEKITPRQIAQGRGDHYLVRLNQSIVHSRQTVYIRPFGEMNGHWNAYCAFNADGSRRRHGHSTSWFRKAWRRMVMIVRGGKRAKINRRLRKQHMPRIYRAPRNGRRVYRRRDLPAKLNRPRVAFMWVPQTFGSPNIKGNQPRNYWPGKRFVDWVGADIYAKFATAGVWSAFKHFYKAHRHHPFVVGEYGAWDNDYNGAFMRRIHRWARSHRRVRALLYFRSVDDQNEYNLQYYPGAQKALKNILGNRKRYPQYAPGTRLPDNGGSNGGSGGGGTSTP